MTGLKTPQNCLFSSHLFIRQSWTKVLGHFCISGAFSNSHRSNPSPHPTNNVGRVYPEFFSEFQLCIGWGGGRTARKFRKRCTVLREDQKITEKYCSTVPRTCPGLKAMNSEQVREGKSNTAGSPFLPRRKESTAITWSIAHQ